MQATKETVALLITTLAELFNRNLSPAIYQAYWIGLSDIDGETLERGVALAIKTCKFMPTPSEIRVMCSDHPATSPEDLAMVAFSAVSNAVSAIGAYKTVSFDDPVANATVRALGGWVAICDRAESEFNTFFRSDFVKQYAAFHRAGVNGEITGPLIGINDQHNLVAGYDQGKLKLVPCGTASSSVRRINGRHRDVGPPKHRIGFTPNIERSSDEPESIQSILEKRALAQSQDAETS